MNNPFYPITKAYDERKPREEIYELYRQVEDKNICDTNNGKRSMLHLAAAYGDPDAIGILLDSGVKVLVTNDYGDNPLHALAGLNGCRWHRPSDDEIYSAAKKLIEAKASILRKNDAGLTCYHLAAKEANYPMIRALIDSGAKLSMTSNEGYTALHLVCMEVRHTISALGYAQEKFDKLKPISEDTRPSLRKIEEEWAQRVTTDLAEVKKKLENYFLIVKDLVGYGLDTDAKDNYGNDALHYAVESDAGKIAAFLKCGNVDDELSLATGGMNLHQAVQKNDAVAIKAILSLGADINEISTDYKTNGKTPLALACGMMHRESIAALLECGADPNYKSGEQGWTAMYALISDSNWWSSQRPTGKDIVDITVMLMNAGLNIDDPVDNKSNTVLISACDGCRIPELIDFLIEKGCDVNLANLDGQTALMLALKERDMKQSENAVITLLENGAATDVSDKNGCTPLMYAAMNNNKTAGRSYTSLLMDFGEVLPEAANNDGKTALDIATENDNEELVKLLIR